MDDIMPRAELESPDDGPGPGIEYIACNSQKSYRMCAIASDFELLPYF